MHRVGDSVLSSSSVTMQTRGDGGLCDPLAPVTMHRLGGGDRCWDFPGQLPPSTISTVVDEPCRDILGVRIHGRRRRFPIPMLPVNSLYWDQRRQQERRLAGWLVEPLWV